jgi:branched-chain amino acid transport system ATP-binding protein
VSILLKVEDLTVYRAGLRVLSDISFEVGEGEVLAVLGSNGSGKTTLLETLIGLHTPKHGRIEYLGRDISYLQPDSRIKRGIALIPEGRQLFPKLTVLENILMGAYPIPWDKKKLQENLQRVFELFPILRERKDQRAGTLSGGEQQMLTIARALISSPKLLMLDEPSSGLGPKLVTSVFKCLREIAGTGVTLIISEQYVAKALEIANKAIVLENGRIVLQGESRDIIKYDKIREAYLGM